MRQSAEQIVAIDLKAVQADADVIFLIWQKFYLIVDRRLG